MIEKEKMVEGGGCRRVREGDGEGRGRRGIMVRGVWVGCTLAASVGF